MKRVDVDNMMREISAIQFEEWKQYVQVLNHESEQQTKKAKSGK